MRTIIQLDDKALQWLWENAGDEFKVEIRNAVLQNFSNKFLKGVFDSEITKQAKYSIEQIVNKAQFTTTAIVKESFNEHLKTNFRIDFWAKETTDNLLKDAETRRILNNELRAFVEQAVDQKLQEMLKEVNLSKIVEMFAVDKLKKKLSDQLTEALNKV